MEKRYAALLPALIGTMLATAQGIDLNAGTNLPVIGGSFTYHTAPYAAPPAGGQGVNFDHSTVAATGSVTWNWFSPSVYSNAAAFPTATIAGGNGADTMFYRTTAQGFERVGERQNLLGTYNVELALTDGPLMLKLPLTYGDTWTDAISSNFSIEGGTGVRTGTITGTADGYGWLLLPTGEPIPVLRVYTYLQETNNVSNVLPFPITITHKRHEHAYYGMWLGSPVLRVISDSLTSSVGVNQFTSSTEWLGEEALSVAMPGTGDRSFELFPNPATQQVDILFQQSGRSDRLTVFDATGALVLTRQAGRMGDAQRLVLDVSAWSPGVYTVMVDQEHGGRSVKRLVVAH